MPIAMTVLVMAWVSGPWRVDLEKLTHLAVGVSSPVVTPDEHVYFIDAQDRTIFHLGPNGEEIGTFGGRGQGPGEFEYVWQVQYLADANVILAVDHGDLSIVVFDAVGGFMRETTVNEAFREATLFLDEDTYIGIRSPDYFRDPSASGAEIVLGHVESGRSTQLLALDERTHPAPMIKKGNNSMCLLSFPWIPRGIVAVNSRQTLAALGSSWSVDFQVFDVSQSRVVGSIEDVSIPRIPLTDREIEDYGCRCKINGRVITAADFDQPDFKAIVHDVFWGANGQLWVQLQTPFGNRQHRFLVYDSTGKRLGAIEVSANQRVFFANDTFLWCVETDEQDDRTWILKRPYALSDF